MQKDVPFSKTIKADGDELIKDKNEIF